MAGTSGLHATASTGVKVSELTDCHIARMCLVWPGSRDSFRSGQVGSPCRHKPLDPLSQSFRSHQKRPPTILLHQFSKSLQPGLPSPGRPFVGPNRGWTLLHFCRISPSYPFQAKRRPKLVRGSSALSLYVTKGCPACASAYCAVVWLYNTLKQAAKCPANHTAPPWMCCDAAG